MDFSIIDELYNIYKNEDISYAKQQFGRYFYKYELAGEHDFIKTIKDYIDQQVPFVSNYFISDKDENLNEHELIKDFVTAFENLIFPIETTIVDYLISTDNYQRDRVEPREPVQIKPHDLFTMDIKIIEDAVRLHGEHCEEDFRKIKNLIQYVKKHQLLKKIYKDDSWHEIDFEELMYGLYDSIKDKSIFQSDLKPSCRLEIFPFEKIKANCSELLSGSFDKFRPNLHSSKQIRADFGKVIFLRNLLTFYETGIMPHYNGFIDMSVDEFEHDDLIEDFKKLYSKNFDETEFKNNQSNFICNPEVYNYEFSFEAGKKVIQGKKFISACIVSCVDQFKSVRNDYLIHIKIDDVNDEYSNYEMQISIIPRGDLSLRLQLMRLDNWHKEMSHKNVAKKLATTTHIHLYNEFDLLRGKENGSFDIAYNLEGESTSFETSLKRFLQILDLGDDVTKIIYNNTMKVVNSHKKVATEKEI